MLNNWYLYSTNTATNTTNAVSLVLSTRIYYKNNVLPKDINEALKRVIIDKSIKLAYYYT